MMSPRFYPPYEQAQALRTILRAGDADLKVCGMRMNADEPLAHWTWVFGLHNLHLAHTEQTLPRVKSALVSVQCKQSGTSLIVRTSETTSDPNAPGWRALPNLKPDDARGILFRHLARADLGLIPGNRVIAQWTPRAWPWSAHALLPLAGLLHKAEKVAINMADDIPQHVMNDAAA